LPPRTTSPSATRTTSWLRATRTGHTRSARWHE
jgi:hypothetical protein